MSTWKVSTARRKLSDPSLDRRVRYQLRHFLAGLCLCCGRPAVRSDRCAKHAAKFEPGRRQLSREHARRLRQAKRETGVCLRCRKRASEGRSMCERHLAEMRRRAAARVQDCKERGICINSGCGSKAAPGHVLCRWCLSNLRVANRRRKARRECTE